MDTAKRPMYQWKAIRWAKVERMVFKLQKRIYRAAQRGATKQVRRLQKLLWRSRAAKLLAVRQITQDNRGKRTAGVDGKTVLTPAGRLALVEELKLDGQAQPVRRVMIPKPGGTEQRPLGIPTIADRAKQSLVKLALEPAWEAKFEPNSYGFRPGRSTWDAIGAIYVQINQKPKWVLDADIAKCFDRIDHAALLRKLDANPTVARQIKAWLQAGMMEAGELFPTEAGVPQGGPLSPLLANVALHGLEERNGQAFPRRGRTPAVIRYADDLVVLHPDREVIEHSRALTAHWLDEMGLELKPSKTRIRHTLELVDGGAGFDFLGFNIRQYPSRARRGYKTIIKPSRISASRHHRQIREVTTRHRMQRQRRLIAALNPVIRGWSHYFSTVCSKETFGELDDRLRQRLRAWMRVRHPDKRRKWGYARYWRREDGKLHFRPRAGGQRLCLHAETPIRRHVKVQGRRTPYDGDEVYWSTRLGHHPAVKPRTARLLKQQEGRCRACGYRFKMGDVLEVDHILARAQGGRDETANWQLLHRYCHMEKTAQERRRCACQAPHA
jgi:RNA-directed DNA polymerase